jgi:photosystem II stability/assembly factor-like uncharacterized protein
MSKRILLAVLVSLLLLSLACGEDNPAKPPVKGWSALGPDEMQVTDLEIAWPYLYACTYPDGLWQMKLTPSGRGWEPLGYSGEYCYDVEVLRDGTILAATSSGLFLSQDAGRTWTPSGGGYGGTVIRLTSCCGAVFAGTGGYGIYRSEDGGRRWTEVYNNAIQYQIQFLCHPANCGFILTTAYTPREDDLLLVSLDGGASWTPRMGPALSYYHGPRAIAVDPTDGNVAYVGTAGAVLRTVDGGASWTPVLEPPEAPWIKALAFDARLPKRFFAAGSGYLYIADEDGETWERARTPFDDEITDLVCDPTRSIVYMSTTAGVYKYLF